MGFKWTRQTNFFIVLFVAFGIMDKAFAKLNDITLCNSNDDIFAYNGEAYFCGNHIENGGELFRTNGTTAGTSVVKDIDIGPGSSSPFGFFEFKGFMFFFAETTQTGTALWRSDGTNSDTKLIKIFDFDFRYYNQIVEGDEELFIHIDDVLLRTDGTNSGTYQIDIPVTEGISIDLGPSHPSSTFAYDNGVLYFITRDILYKLELSNNALTLIEELPGKEEEERQSAVIVDDSLISGSFLILDNNGLWESDGTESGTRQIESNFRYIAKFNNGLLYCDLDDGSLYLRKAGVQAANLLYENLEPSCFIRDFGLISDSIAITVGIGESAKLWVTDGTMNSTTQLIDLLNIDASGFRFNSRVYKLPNGYVFSLGGLGFSELWITDGTVSGTQLVKRFLRTSISNLISTSSGVFFTIGSRPQNNYQLWHSDGTSGGTRLVRSIPAYIEHGDSWAEGQRMYFLIDNSELWHSDSTSSGTYKLRYSTPDPKVSIENENKAILQAIMLLLDEE